jgi:predicted transposase/invertase (TIGR01784 family)
MVKVIPLQSGPMFKHIFGQVEIFKAFVKDVVGVELNIDRVHMEYEYPKPIGYVKTKYDLFAEDVTGRVVVEIQHVKEGDFFDRFLYYHLISLAEQVKGAKAYQFDRVVYTIVVLTSIPQDKSVNFSVAVSSMNPVTEHGKNLAIYPHRLVFLAPRLVNEETPPLIREWLELIKDSLDEEMDEGAYPRGLFQEIIKGIEETEVDPDTLAQIKDEKAWEDVQATAHEKGRKEERLETARKMLADGLDPMSVAKYTGLSTDELTQL